jgi:hypothetical protein
MYCRACGSSESTAAAQRERYRRDKTADIEAAVRYRVTPAGREVHRLQDERRCRLLSKEVVLNSRFPGSHQHHLTMDTVAYIPAGLHMSTRHNIWTGEGMEAMNARVMEFMGGAPP